MWKIFIKLKSTTQNDLYSESHVQEINMDSETSLLTT